MSKQKKGGKVFLYLVSLMVFLLGIPCSAFSAPPGILTFWNGWGAATWTNPGPFTSIFHYVGVVDHEEEFADDGSSHTVTVTYPNGGPTKTLLFTRKSGRNNAIYQFYDDTVSQPIDVAAYSGDYVFRVVRASNREWSEAIDNLQVNPVGPLDGTSFRPGFDPLQSIIAYFDDVYINGVLFDDFNSAYDPGKWNPYPPEAIFENGQVRFAQLDSVGRGSAWLSLANPEGVNEVKTTVSVATITSEIPKARIGAFFCRVDNNDIWSEVGIQGSQAVYSVMKERWEGNHYILEPVVYQAQIGALTSGNRYDLTLSWEQASSTLTFEVVGRDDSVRYSADYNVTGIIVPPANQLKAIGVSAWVETDTTTPTFTWDEVPGATRYEIIIYNSNYNRLNAFYAQAPPFILPPGILRPYGIYNYDIRAIKEPRWFSWDNIANSNLRETSFYVATSNEAQEPAIDLFLGAYTWRGDRTRGPMTLFLLRVHDAQGVPSNIESVEVLFPDKSKRLQLYLDYNESPTCGRYRAFYAGPFQPGEYSFTVLDKDGHIATTKDVLDPDPIGYPSEDTLVPADNAVLGQTGISLVWEDVPGAAFYYLYLYDKDLNRIYEGATTASHFTLPSGLLKENAQYRYIVETWREFLESSVSNVSQFRGDREKSYSFFTTVKHGTEAPTMDLGSSGVSVFQGPDQWSGEPNYYLEFRAMVTDPDGVPENIEQVEVTYPDGSTKRVLKYNNNPNMGFNYYASEIYENPSLIPSGTYTFKVKDFERNEVEREDTLSDVAANVLSSPTGLLPADGAIMETNTPTIIWNAVPGASYYKVRIMAGTYRLPTIYWSPALTATQFSVPLGVLEPHTMYAYRVYAYREAIGSEVDFYSCNVSGLYSGYRFTTGEQTLSGAISGEVTTGVTGQNTAIVGATVTIEELGLTTTSGSDGSFVFTSVPVGAYTLKVEKDGFETILLPGIQVLDGQTTAAPMSEMTIAQVPPGLPGDANDDGFLGLDDVIYILQVLSGAR